MAAAAIDAYDRALAIDPGFHAAQSGRLFCLNYDERRSAADVAAEHRRRGEALQAAAPPAPVAWPNPPDPDRRLRVGYVSGDFHTHPVGWFLVEALAAHDRAAMEVFCYAGGPRADAMTERLQAASDHWRWIAGMGDAQAEAAIRGDGADVLIDLSGHTAYGRLDLFARRPAPVQAAWLGYVATTGLPAIDYLLTDQETAPAGAEALFTETLLRSDCGRFCYAPPDDAPAVAPSPWLSGRPFAFGSFNDTLKLSPRTIRLWAKVLAVTPGSRLILKWRSLVDAAVRARLSAAFEAAGIGADRLDLRGHSPHADMLSQYADVDVALDPLGFSGGMTSCEALWMGVPVVTLPEQKPASRQTMAFLTRMGLTGLVATSEDDFVRIAEGLANDRETLAALRRDLRPRLKVSPVRQSDRFMRAHEALIREMWRRWCAKA
jgi:predicted O-linked N-acetylglucosamine transferase (SPINDLY family)